MQYVMESDRVDGKGSMLVAVLLEMVQNVVVSGLLISSCAKQHYKFRLGAIKKQPTFALVAVLCGVYLVINFIASMYLLYATVSNNITLGRRKFICNRWMIYRVLTFLIPITYFFITGDLDQETGGLICAAVILIWILVLGIVATFVANISNVLNNKNRKSLMGSMRRYRKPRNSRIVPIHDNNLLVTPSSTSIRPPTSSRPPVKLSEEQLKQLEQFQDYVRRTSWCSRSDDGSRTSISSATQSRF